MLTINKSNMNEMITLEEAETILVMAKRIYPQLNGLTVIEGEEFAYWHYNKEYNCESPFITIPFMPFDERMESVSDFIIGLFLTFLRLRSIAFCPKKSSFEC